MVSHRCMPIGRRFGPLQPHLTLSSSYMVALAWTGFHNKLHAGAGGSCFLARSTRVSPRHSITNSMDCRLSANKTGLQATVFAFLVPQCSHPTDLRHSGGTSMDSPSCVGTNCSSASRSVVTSAGSTRIGEPGEPISTVRPIGFFAQ